MKIVTGQEQVLLMATLDFRCQSDSCEAYEQVSLEVTEWRSLVLVYRFLPSSILCPCWGVPQQGSCRCGGLPWAAALQGIWPCPPLWPLPIRWSGDPSWHVLLQLTSPAFVSGSPPCAPSVRSQVFSWFHWLGCWMAVLRTKLCHSATFPDMRWWASCKL